MMDALGSESEDSSIHKKKTKKFRLFGKKRSQPAQLDPNCPQCNPQLLAAIQASQQKQQQHSPQKHFIQVQESVHKSNIRDESSSIEGDEDAIASIPSDRMPCQCRKCHQARAERPLTVELLPMDTQVPLQNMMQDAAFMCALL